MELYTPLEFIFLFLISVQVIFLVLVQNTSVDMGNRESMEYSSPIEYVQPASFHAGSSMDASNRNKQNSQYIGDNFTSLDQVFTHDLMYSWMLYLKLLILQNMQQCPLFKVVAWSTSFSEPSFPEFFPK